MNEPIITISGLTKRYGTLAVVNGLDLSIHKGEVFGLLGPNGAGKSTTILMLLGLTEPSAGKVSVCGIDPTLHPIEVKKKVGYLPDDVGFYDGRSGLENLLYTARLNRLPKEEAYRRARQLLDQVGLGNDGDKKAGIYSRGMRQRLGLADVLIKDPEIIILDEPTLGIDPRGVREFLDLIVHLSRKQGITVLLSSHHLHQVQQVCDRVGLFVSGKLIAEGDIATLSARLFAGEPLLIEVNVACPGRDEMPVTHEKEVLSLLEALREVEGIGSVRFTGGTIHIGCNRDASAAIARTVTRSGFGLTHLQKKTYGLDEIYHRYFEGGESYGKTA
ncbi:ABC transporter ATP-binding protein [Flavitalea sp. BT771]|uniref:ABC transporter ATP-binding protein n=1 Tax=Flavitalea sp. BT771 TaxID=3063329 RepID=UPI0026E4642E|nr:ABC transporter ATP-binding protein [Flavitalea sp. BT771]MDO6428990.1 ABC transporter ATP-binding protein [Flavitalea sp. BT771]MDV6218882.1 ABC transporter ATP-binding protein [Flavitalea sp. BT771]